MNRIPLARTFTFLLLWLVLLLVVGEIFARLVLTSPSRQLPDAELGYVNRPDTVIFQAKEGFERQHLNELGLNDEPVGPRQPGRTRLLLIGDSMLFAQQVRRAENYSTLLEDRLGADVINGGRDALGPQQWPASVRRLAPATSPDVVVVMLTGGDAYDLMGAKVRFEPNPVTGETQVRFSQGGADAVQEKLAPLLQRSALATFLGRRAAIVWKGLHQGNGWLALALNGFHRPEVKAEPAPGPGTTADLARIMKLVADKTPVVFVSIPTLEYHGSRDVGLVPRSAAERAVFAGAAKEAGVPYLDIGDELCRTYRRNGRPFTGFENSEIGIGHLNSYGHGVVADILAQRLPDLLKQAGGTASAPAAIDPQACGGGD